MCELQNTAGYVNSISYKYLFMKTSKPQLIGIAAILTGLAHAATHEFDSLLQPLIDNHKLAGAVVMMAAKRPMHTTNSNQ